MRLNERKIFVFHGISTTLPRHLARIEKSFERKSQTFQFDFFLFISFLLELLFSLDRLTLNSNRFRVLWLTCDCELQVCDILGGSMEENLNICFHFAFVATAFDSPKLKYKRR